MAISWLIDSNVVFTPSFTKLGRKIKHSRKHGSVWILEKS
jgi:hypothetical protein